jgi:CheY-like chemotaxis protein
MAGETILVVDDAPVSLKLAATVLRSEGYKVHLACSAEEALMTLRTMVPHLLLVDLQLPNMNGLELTRHLRQDPRTREMLIVALTASVMAEAEQLAYDAGCDGFIAKPIDTRSLGRRLRRYLNSHSAPAPEPGSAPGGLPIALSFSGPEMEGLRRSFLADGSRQVRRLLAFVNARLDTDEAARMCHQWVGSAGALGYMELAEQARAAEALLFKPGWTKSDLRDTLIARFGDLKEKCPHEWGHGSLERLRYTLPRRRSISRRSRFDGLPSRDASKCGIALRSSASFRRNSRLTSVSR